MSIKLSTLIFILIIIYSLPAVAESQYCQYATKLVSQSYDYGIQGRSYEEKRLLKQALQYCPNHAIAHNNLASILEDESDYNQDSYNQVKKLLKNNSYAVTEQGRILNKQSLLLLFDKQKRNKIKRLISACGMKGIVRSKATFSNITFHTGSYRLTQAAKSQINNLAAAFNQTMPSVIKLHGHTDIQGFTGVTNSDENDRLNLQLSEQRAEAVKTELAARGVDERLIQTRGYGSRKPLVRGDFAQNRRVEIETVD